MIASKNDFIVLMNGDVVFIENPTEMNNRVQKEGLAQRFYITSNPTEALQSAEQGSYRI
ncbi:hypothetical protein [Cohnella nanjingensis]|uniref:hypothetical protein n=1 Tax=Cohnella nanjingensis TaxID=1387779 RepID=UPI001C874921|nr:hypothetical protein [Cohnella nanjingensis]